MEMMSHRSAMNNKRGDFGAAELERGVGFDVEEVGAADGSVTVTVTATAVGDLRHF